MQSEPPPFTIWPIGHLGRQRERCDVTAGTCFSSRTSKQLPNETQWGCKSRQDISSLGRAFALVSAGERSPVDGAGGFWRETVSKMKRVDGHFLGFLAAWVGGCVCALVRGVVFVV